MIQDFFYSVHSTIEGSCCKQGGQVKPGKLLSSQWPITHIDMPHLQHRYEVLVCLFGNYKVIQNILFIYGDSFSLTHIGANVVRAHERFPYGGRRSGH